MNCCTEKLTNWYILKSTSGILPAHSSTSLVEKSQSKTENVWKKSHNQWQQRHCTAQNILIDKKNLDKNK